MSLKKKFSLILILALALHILAVVIYLKLFLARDISENLPHMQHAFAAAFNGLGPDMTLKELGILLKQNLQDPSFLNVIFFNGVLNTIKMSLLLLPILLGVVLFFIDREILKPLNKLGKVINDFNHKNGYVFPDCSKNEILKLSKSFFIMSEQLELNKRQKDEFISCISHDLKTPLTSILGYTQRLIDPGIPDPEKRFKYYQTILSKANTIQTLVEELNLYAMAEIQELSFQKVNLKKFLGEIVEEYHEELLTYNIQLKPSIDLSETIWSSLDINQMRRVFANIFSNSVIHGGRNMQIIFAALIEDEKLLIRIENNGQTPDNLDYDRVFELMYRADTARTHQNNEGSGLGLTIVKKIIENHNGSIKAYKPSSHGFGIECYIPLS